MRRWLRRHGVTTTAAGMAIIVVVTTGASSRSCESSADRVSSAGINKANQRLGRRMAIDRGWGGRQWTCLNNLWIKESRWEDRIWNTQGSGAYGIPQARPARKMRSAGRDWRTNPETQIKWGLRYIKSRYGTPCGAWSYHKRHNAY